MRIYNVALTAQQQAYLVPPPPLPPIRLSSSIVTPSGGNPGQLVLTWLNGTLLLESTNVAGPWKTNTATPPYTNLMTKPADFFKTQTPNQIDACN